MLGAIIGDMVGSPYEFTIHNIKTTQFPLFSQESRFTDDTVMTVAVAEGLMQGQDSPEAAKEAIIDAMHKYGRLFPHAGYGQRFRAWLADRQREAYGSYGNGSAMRVSSVGWAFSSLESVERYARISAAVTHDHPEGIKGACATAGAIFLARTGSAKEDIRAYVSSRYAYDLSRTVDEIRPGYVHVESCQGSVPEAITAFLDSNSFEDALRKAVSLGGDSDTIAAIAGSIAEAFYAPIPQAIVDEALSRLDKRLIQVIDAWQAWLKEKGRCASQGC